MKPKNSKLKAGCPDDISAKCVQWNGPDIPCLEICTDDMLTEVVHAIGTKVCEISEELDLSTLTLGCLIDHCDTCPQEKSLKTVLQLMLDNDCKLKNLIDDIIDAINNAGSGGGAVVLTLNYRCLEILDDFGNPVYQDLNQTLQSIINELCAHKTTLEDHEARLTTIETTYCKPPCGGGGSGYVEPTIDLCTSSVPKPLSLATIDLGNDYCDYKENVGTPEEILTALSRQCGNLNSIYGLTPGFILDPNSLADTTNNQWVVLCDLLARVTNIETTCCAPSCGDIKIGFEATYDEAAEEFILSFTYANGTEIPVGFTDCGSIITLTDVDGRTKTLPITLENGLEFSISSLAPLKTATAIAVTIKTCFTHTNGLKCNDCIGGTLPAVQPCGFCKLCTNGGSASDFVTISYTRNGTPTVATIFSGECMYFENADDIQITSISSTSPDISVIDDPEYPCDGLIVPEISEPTCWFFKIPVSYITFKNTSNTPFTDVRSTDLVPSWTKIFTMMYPNGTTVGSSKILDIFTPGEPNDQIYYFPGYPGTLPTGVKDFNAEGGGCETHYRTQMSGGNISITYGTDFPNGNKQFGLKLQVMGQPDSIPPMMEFADPVNGALVRIVGEYLPDCECPSL